MNIFEVEAFAISVIRSVITYRGWAYRTTIFQSANSFSVSCILIGLSIYVGLRPSCDEGEVV